MVLDSSAVLAVLFNEPGSGVVVSVLDGGLLSTVNLAETHSRLVQRGIVPGFAWDRLMAMGFEIRAFTQEQARIAAELIDATKRYGLSLGDRACLALAIECKTPVYTTDRAWKGLDLGIKVQVIR